MNILNYIKNQEISQAHFAEMVDVSVGMVNQWIHGHRPVSPEKSVLIEQLTNGQVSRKDLHPDNWGAIWPELKEVA